MLFAEIAWLGWVIATAWWSCVLLAVTYFVIVDILNNRKYGWWGVRHTLARLPMVFVLSPLYLAMIVWSFWSDWRHPEKR